MVSANLTAASGQTLSVRAYVAPDENVLVAEVGADPPLMIHVTTQALPLSELCKGSLCETMDGRIAAGVTDAGGTRGPVLWSQRQPLGLSSPKPISVAVATASVGGPSLSGCAARASDFGRRGGENPGSQTSGTSTMARCSAGRRRSTGSCASDGRTPR